MTREEFIKKYKNDCRYYFDVYYSDCIDESLTNIYNDHEAQLKAKDERIKELEEAMKPKTCSTCKYEILSGWMRGCEVQAWDVFSDGAHDSHIDDDFCCNRYEPKD